MNKKNLLILYILFILLLFLTNFKSYNNIKYNIPIKKSFTLNKIIIVGDSRMELINKSSVVNIPDFVFIDAKGGAKIDWLKSIGIPVLNENIKDNKYHYHIVFNLGVNDLNRFIDIDLRVKEYYKLYRNIYMMNKNKNISYYFLSVNPVDENTIYNYWPSNIRTNNKIEYFNNKMIELDSKDRFMTYCDSYNTLNFKLYDGLHFEEETNKLILKYIIRSCVNLNF